jgi:uncharacterized protein (TIGR03435 family)
MRRSASAAILAAAIAGSPSALAQAPVPPEQAEVPERVAFESAVVRENHLAREENPRFGTAIDESGSFRATYVTLLELIMAAYDARAQRIVDGPDWIHRDRFDIVAQAPESFDPDDTHAMIRSLLEDRFGLVVRREVRETATFALVRPGRNARLGRGIRAPVPCRDRAPTSAGNQERRDPASGDDCRSRFGYGLGHLFVRRSPLSALLPLLSSAAGREVLDRTELRGTYDIDVRWSPDPGSVFAWGATDVAALNGGVSILTAVREQLGLELRPATERLDVLTIVRAERPGPD